MTAPPSISPEKPAGHFIHLTTKEPQDFLTTGTLQVLDDCGPGLTFAKADIYSDAKVTLNKDRVLRHVVLPYTQVRSSRDYSWYQRMPSV